MKVRNLAQRAAQSAKETAAKIENAVTKTAQGVQITLKVSKTLQEIVGKARQVDELAAEVASASKEQFQGIEQVNIAVAQMDKATQSNAASAEESAAAAEELNAHAETLKQSVAELLHLVGGKSGVAPTESAPPAMRTKEVHRAAPVLKRPTLTRNHGKGNGHTHAAPASAAAGNRRSEFPMEGDFKDF